MKETMKDKKKQDRSLAETPEARLASLMQGEEQSLMEDYGACGQMDLREMIARRAYEIYEERGRCDGEDMNDWLRAEAEVKSLLMAKMPRPVASRPSAG